MRARWMFLVFLAVPGMLSAARTARLTEPKGTITETSPTFTWSAVDQASRYDLWVVGRDGPKITAAIAPADGCGNATCSFTPEEPLAPGPYLWLVLSRIPGSIDRWSIPRRFTVSPDGARPGKVEPISPSGEIDDAAPSFSWRSEGANADYELVVRGSKPRTYFREIYSGASICNDELCTAPPSLTNLTLGDGRYRWTVRASNLVGRGPRSDSMRFDVRTLPRPPARPTLVAPRGRTSETSPLFVWNKAERASEYYLEIRRASGGVVHGAWHDADATLCPDATCAIAPAGLVLDFGRYRFRVTGKNIAGPGRRSRSMSFRVGDFLDKPTPIAPEGVTSTSPTFQWQPVSDATTYVLRVRQDRLRIATVRIDASTACDTTICSAQLDAPLAEGQYRWSVIARSNVRRSSSPSDWMFFDAKAGGGSPPATPEAIAPAGVVEIKTPTFHWSHVDTATMYKLTVMNATDPVLYTHTYSVDVASCTVTDGCKVVPPETLDNGIYSFTVEAINDAGSSPPSLAKNFEVKVGGGTPPGIPELIAPTGTVDTGTPAFSWKPVDMATSYVLTVKDAVDPVVYTYAYDAAAICGPASCSVTPADVLANGAYTYLVTAKEGDVSGTPAQGAFEVDVNNPPAPPELISPSGTVDTATPAFSWKPVDMATSYVLTVKDAVDPVVYTYAYDAAAICAPASCSVTPADVLANGAYTYLVTAKEGDVSGTPAQGTFEVDVNDPPAATTPLSPAGQIAEGNPTFTWTVVPDAVAYTLVVFDDLTEMEIHRIRYPLAALTCDDTQCTITPDPGLNLKDGTYSFTVITENADGLTTTSSILVFNVSSAPPNLRVTSHTDGDTLTSGGLLISGTVDSGTVSLTAELAIDGTVVMAARPVEISNNDAWTVFLLPGQLSPGSAVLTLVATDGNGGTSTLPFNFNVVAFDLKESMLLTRATFGATPALLDEVRSGGVTAFQDRLLNPVPDPAFDAFVASLPTSSEGEAREYALMHALFNPNPLQEVMTQFWDNHFSTDMDSHDVPEFELRENDNFRANALGRFRDLLEISAKSPAMLIYLDATNNVVGDPNENYARELLELSTLGVNGGYSQDDVEELARILTGWKEVGGNFQFVSGDHDFGTKTFLGVTFPTNAGAGLAEGEAVLDMLSEHRSTAEFLCTKLVELFISENPRAGLVAGCADVFQAEHLNGNPNQMRDVVRFLLDSPDFVDPSNFKAKVKTPLELLATTVRHLDATVDDRRDLERDLDGDLDMELFGKNSPDGFSEVGDDWIDTSLLLARVDFVNEVARETGANDTYVDIRAYFQDKGLETAEGIVGYLFRIALQNEFTDLELGIAYDILSARGTSQFDINGADAEARLRQLVGTVFSFPGFQHQ